jgi:hypothetical protein
VEEERRRRKKEESGTRGTRRKRLRTRGAMKKRWRRGRRTYGRLPIKLRWIGFDFLLCQFLPSLEECRREFSSSI